MEELTPAKGVLIGFIEGDNLVYQTVFGVLNPKSYSKIDKDSGLTGYSIKTKEILYSENVPHDPRVNKKNLNLKEIQSLALAPFLYNSHVVGILKITSPHKKAFKPVDLEILHLAAGLISSAIAHHLTYENAKKRLLDRTATLEALKKTQARLEYLADHDYLTNTVTRRLLNERLDASLKKTTPPYLNALIYLDIDYFKQINDQLGHEVGDELLIGFAERLQHCVRLSDTVCRFGGDEFIVLLQDLGQKRSGIEITERILAQAREDFRIHSHTIKITISLGIVFFTNQGINHKELLGLADKALYLAKEEGRNCYCILEAK